MNNERNITCVSDLEERILNQVLKGEIKVGMFGNWLPDQNPTIEIKGRVLTKGYFPRWCIRWEDKTRGGIFHKGLAQYTGPEYPFDLIKHLPITK